MKRYVAGNWLRGYFEGEFEDSKTAWSYLSKRFLLSYPSEGGRHIGLWVEEPNNYGKIQLQLMNNHELTEINNLPREEVLEKCKQSSCSFL